MQNDDETLNKILAAMCRFLARHERAIDDVAEALLCLIPLVENQLPRCSRTGCGRPATHKHSELGVLACDACCRVIMETSLKKLTGDMEDPVNVARFAAARDDMWIELDHAESVRQLTCYLDVIVKNRYTGKKSDGTLH